MPKAMRDGDTLDIKSIDRLGWNKAQTKKYLEQFKKEGIRIKIIDLPTTMQEVPEGQEWVTDITYLLFNGQTLYLSAVKDLYNNEIVAYEISRRNDLRLVIDMLEKAIKHRNVKGILLHSDQGIQYTSQPVK